MAEPEDVIAEGALLATRAVRAMWARRTAVATERPPGLEELRHRLELFVAAIFPGAPEIGAAETPAPPSFLARLARRRSSHLHPRVALSSTDGRRIRLPGRLDGSSAFSILDRYRLLALEQAARASRGTSASLPGSDPLLRDLYLLSEAAAVDALIVRMLPRLGRELRSARQEAHEHRTAAPRPSRQDVAMEALVEALLAAEPDAPPFPFIVASTSVASRQWAEAERAGLVVLAGPYHGMAPVPLWGTTAPPPESPATAGQNDSGGLPRQGRSRSLPRRPRVREAAENEDDAESGTWMVRSDDLQEKAEDPAGLQRPSDRDEHADPGELADALSELPELRLVRSSAVVREVLIGGDPIPRAATTPETTGSTGIAYPEWDWRIDAYRPRGAIVRQRVAVEGNDAWIDAVLHRHAAMIRAVRREFERLRPRRTALRRQSEGADVDVDALVAALADRRAGGVADDRCYIDTRPLRRDAAIALLVDASASTDSWVKRDQRIIDVEKESLLVVAEALGALGDPHGIFSFGGEGPARVEVHAIKQFEERAGSVEIHRRIAGLEPEGYTRAGAAIRHATAELLRQPARHRLLLILSDGRPNDVDQYEGRYGIEDTRVAVVEARMQGIHCFCLTVDREAPRYATRIFGRDFAVLSRAERLPMVLTTVLRDLVRG